MSRDGHKFLSPAAIKRWGLVPSPGLICFDQQPWQKWPYARSLQEAVSKVVPFSWRPELPCERSATEEHRGGGGGCHAGRKPTLATRRGHVGVSAHCLSPQLRSPPALEVTTEQS